MGSGQHALCSASLAYTEEVATDPDETRWMRDGYEQCYYTGALKNAWALVHRTMERPFGPDKSLPHVLELGAGQGQHCEFVRHRFERYTMTDLRPDLIVPQDNDPRFEIREVDASDLSQFPDGAFDRIIATCLLVHLDDPLSALQEWRRVVKPGGHLTIYIPCEPGLLTRIIRKSYIWPKARRNGLKDPELMTYTGHKIHYPALRTFLRHVFVDDEVTVVRRPIPRLPWNLALFDVYQVRREPTAARI